MIDSIDISINCIHSPQGKIVKRINPDTGEVKHYREKFKVKNSYKNSLTVKSYNDGTQIRISGNFVKFIQGHNIVGSNNLVGIVYEVVQRVLKELDIAITDVELESIRNGHFKVYSVDIAWGYRQEAKLIPYLIDEVGNCWRLRGRNASNYKSETVYWNQHSTELALKFYNKRRELGNKPLPLNLPYRNKLLEYSIGLIRAELTLHSKALSERGLTQGYQWSIAKVSELIELAVQQAQLTGSMNRKLIPAKILTLDRKLRQAYLLWASGFDLTELYDSQVLRRLRNSFSACDINIHKSPVRVNTRIISIAECFSVDNKLKNPKWAIKAGLLFIPKK